jgi:hypothetical protein
MDAGIMQSNGCSNFVTAIKSCSQQPDTRPNSEAISSIAMFVHILDASTPSQLDRRFSSRHPIKD